MFSSCTSPLRRAQPVRFARRPVVGRVAKDAGVGRLIVSHIGQFDLDPAIAELKTFYTGPLTVGADLQCTPVQ
jgi:ribonuclease BN (tRNA processing enzyme)